MNVSLLSWLYCLFCGGPLSEAKADRKEGELDYGILSCYCGQYPVVAGIPILKKNDVTGKVQEAIALIEAGRHREALLSMIIPSPPVLGPGWLRSLPSVMGIRKFKRLVQERALSEWRTQAAPLLTNETGQTTACDLFELYFHKQQENFNYFAYRFGQPRYLVALSFTSLIHQPKKPILDLACGCGHVTRSLTYRALDQLVVGVDDFFFGLYVAKHWIAPQAEYVCCAADTSLPFADDTFSVAFCSDAFFGFVHKTTSLRELQRVTQDDGLIMLVRVDNRLVRHAYDSVALPPDGYRALVADRPHRLVADSDVLARYLHKKGPFLARSADLGYLVKKPSLSVVISNRQEVFQDYGTFEDWPHAEGLLNLNPLYVVDGYKELGHVSLRRALPSVFYEQEHVECKAYLAESIQVPSEVYTNLEHGNRTPELDKLIAKCVVLGMPERFR
jgi:ubiquinone/menaquinone biosynthesis C-methylase UbiE